MLASLVLLVFGCGREGGSSSIAGRICDPLGVGWLEGATVYTHVWVGDWIFRTETDETGPDGRWLFDGLPAGDRYRVYAYIGFTALEEQTAEGIQLGEGEQLVLSDPECVDPSQVRVAVVSGGRDDLDAAQQGEVAGVTQAQVPLLASLAVGDGRVWYSTVAMAENEGEDGRGVVAYLLSGL